MSIQTHQSSNIFKNDKIYIESAENLLHELKRDQKTLSDGISYLQENGSLDDLTKSVLSTINESITNKWGEDSTKKILQILSIAKRQIREREVILSHHKILHDYSLKDFETIQTLIKKHSVMKHKKTINFGFKTCEDCDSDLDLQFRPVPSCPEFLKLKPLEKCMCNSRLPLKKCSECFFKIASKNLSEENDSVQDLNQISCLTSCLECGRKICVFGVICVFPEASVSPPNESSFTIPLEKRKTKDSLPQFKKSKLEPRRCSKCKQPGHLVTTCKVSNDETFIQDNDFNNEIDNNVMEFVSPLTEKKYHNDEETLKNVMSYLNNNNNYIQ